MPEKDEVRKALANAGALDLLGREVRTVKHSGAEVRSDDNAPVVHGYGAVFNSETNIAGLFTERIAPTAFNKTIADGADVRHLINHDPNLVLGRTKSGTTRLSVDEKGLRFETNVNTEDSAAMDAVARIKRGDMDQSSFAMVVVDDVWEDRDDGLPMREIREAQLFDVSTVTYPAYEAASSMVRAAQWRSVEDALGMDPAEVMEALKEELNVTTDADTGEEELPAAEEAPDPEEELAAEEAPAEETDEAERMQRALLQLRMRFLAREQGLEL